jgi:hypothetical protein
VRLVSILLAAGIAMPASALAAGSAPGSNPLAPGLPSSPAPTPTASTPTIINPTTSTSTSGGGLSGGSAIAIALGAVILLAGISFFIWRDARRRAPVRHAAHATAGNGRTPGSKRVKPRKLSAAEKRRRKRGRAR